MTIFIEVIKELICDLLEKSNTNASVKDNGVISGPARNKELSKSQIDLIKLLQKDIDNFKANADDATNLKQLKQIILDSEQALTDLRSEHGEPTGKTNKMLLDINTKLDQAHHTFSNFKFSLLDRINDAKPFTILCLYALKYIAEETFSPTPKSFGKAWFFSSADIRNKKEEILLTCLMSCDKTLSAFIDNADEERRKTVIGTIETIQRKNAELCRAHQIITSIPIEIGVGSAHVKVPVGKPSRGRLEEYMHHALLQIDPEYYVQESTNNGSKSHRKSPVGAEQRYFKAQKATETETKVQSDSISPQVRADGYESNGEAPEFTQVGVEENNTTTTTALSMNSAEADI